MLDFLVAQRAISEELRSRMLGWRYSGFSVHNQVRVPADDAEGRKKLAGTMLRAPLSLAKMTYDAASGRIGNSNAFSVRHGPVAGQELTRSGRAWGVAAAT
ncbi:MAG: hypothetical protein ACREVR_14140 [Burkholderiales bacterium]